MIDTQANLALHAERVTRTVVMIDVVESVRLMEEDEEGVIQRWLSLVNHVAQEIVPANHGRLVKSTGDGILIEFSRPQAAITAAFAVQRASDIANLGIEQSRRILLRIGIETGELVSDERDVYGRGVNLAARLTTLAGPGEIVVSARVRDHLTPLLDADVEDLGNCYVKHLDRPIRAYRVGPPGPEPVIESGTAAIPELRPTVAVIPFVGRGNEPEHHLLGEVLADEIISVLSRTSELNVISRLSTTAFRERGGSLTDIRAHLHANYVLSGAYRTIGARVALDAQLADPETGRIVWARTFKGNVARIMEGADQLIDQIVADTSAAILTRELQRAQALALPTLESYTLLMAAIALMHRLSAHDFDHARRMLQMLIDRAPRQAIPYAWLAKWHVLRVQQGWSDNPATDATIALDCTRRALDADPACSLALTIDGLVHTNLLKRLDDALEKYETALHSNPSDSLAWLLKGTLHAFRGEGKLAVEGTRRALRLSPLDPMRYYYESLASTAALSAGQYDRSIELAVRSLRLNRTHTSTLRAMAISQWLSGREEDARRTVAELRRLEPSLTVRTWLDRSPTSAYETGRVWSQALEGAGLPVS